jgi:cyanamide hydratase
VYITTVTFFYHVESFGILTYLTTGRTITAQHFPDWKCSHETLLLTALLHDIGTTSHNQSSTKLSFEFQGGIISLNLLRSLDAEVSQAEAVCEAIIRHQDLGDTGNITTLTAIIHFATVLDNAGLHAELVHDDTIKSVVARYPRLGWTGCFASVVRKECELKPWANTTRIEGFAELVEANRVMEPYDL